MKQEQEIALLEQAFTLPIGTLHDNLKSEDSSEDNILIRESTYTMEPPNGDEEEESKDHQEDNKSIDSDESEDTTVYSGPTTPQWDTFHFIDQERFGSVLYFGPDYFVTVIDVASLDTTKRADTTNYVPEIDLSIPNHPPICFEHLRRYTFFRLLTIPIWGHIHYKISKRIFPQLRGNFSITAHFVCWNCTQVLNLCRSNTVVKQCKNTNP
jgi:hypothetical protein